MNDSQVTLQKIKEMVAQFVRDRDWNQFHSPKNLSMDISVEAAELMELFLWAKDSEIADVVEKKREAIEEEVSDVLLALFAFANACNIDVATAFERKMKKNIAKYPIELAKGSSKKYTEL
jgi:dCTP diphosphatase